ncbi:MULTISPECIES: helix-turn-helix transcriptional regulator [Pseudoalteromonas]|uniref:Helix-turn-helix transcriptional regulator n=1 Tax=Pseudoalteromonas obscura TaxID=3048491 RepID=A0ABT7EKA1_9GAMM|nr:MULTISPECIES: helix-turn-helix transcriptional regulator [Pseudoalteromonas]MBQ4837334.1 helix-turn-helix domain-containing protein [Pseudoalteromonas luteoviolacea]MDK2595442.1 helix-turn-helix transcriptional regulator [Pseudoalteromonas sp. P94(2023)]
MKFKALIINAIKLLWLEISIVTKSMRLDSGLSQCELGKRLLPSVNESTISAWEEGEEPIPVYQFIMICFVCGFTSEKKTKQQLKNQRTDKK